MTRADTPSPPPDLEDLEALVLEVFARVWEEFSVADVEYCETTIGSLATARVAKDSVPSTESEESIALPHDIYHLGSRPSSVDASTFDPFKPHAPRVFGETDLPTLTAPPAVEPYPEYESWTPTNRSIFRGDDSDDLQFLPFADEPSFDKQAYRSFFKTLAWQGGERMDVDLELIVLEAAHRLHFDCGIELERIDNANVLSFALLGDSGLIHGASQRDLFKWKGAARTTSFPLPRPPVPDALDLRGRLDSLLGDFCPSLGCIDFYCLVHNQDKYPRPAPPVATKTTRDLWRECEKACGPKCFQNIEKGDMSEETAWEDWDWEEFRTILGMAPDALPCQLAVLCRKPCRELFMHRTAVIDDEYIVARRNDPPKTARKRKVAQRGRGEKPGRGNVMTGELCEHAGPCRVGRGCRCYDTESHCDRNCGCPLDCGNRRVGCRCHVVDDETGIICGGECPCIEGGHECNPELCVSCDARNPDTKCGNCQIQHEEKYVQIIKSQWGFGTALLEPAREDELIIEYTGELVFPTSVDLNRQFLGDYMGRKYTYTLNEGICIDSVNTGNHSRFINHSGTPNCYARVTFVNGEQRIGILALSDLEEGEELFLDYGEDFFQEVYDHNRSKPRPQG